MCGLDDGDVGWKVAKNKAHGKAHPKYLLKCNLNNGCA